MSDFEQPIPPGWRVWRDAETNLDAAADGPHAQSLPQPRWQRELDRITGNSPQKTRAVPIKELIPLLLDAARANRAWLQDFADDIAVIDADLHEVLLAYQKLQFQASRHSSYHPESAADDQGRADAA